MAGLELSVVVPVWNEQEAVDSVLTSWDSVLTDLGIDFEIRAYDDGSTDGTAARLDALARLLPRLTVVHQENRGHGPTILRGYGEAGGEWVFQTDSDDEIAADAFATLWSRRGEADVIIGVRTGRESDAARRVLTAGAAVAVRWLFGCSVRDVNVPFRLVRREALRQMVPRVPSDTFAPNVILSGLYARDGLRCVEVPVPTRPRATGTTSLLGLKVWVAAWCAVRQTVSVAISERLRGRRA